MELCFRIYGEDPQGNEDSIVLHGDAIDDIKIQADHEISKRNWTNCWSEELV